MILIDGKKTSEILQTEIAEEVLQIKKIMGRYLIWQQYLLGMMAEVKPMLPGK